MIFHDEEQKRYAFVTLGLIVILITVTIFNQSSFQFSDTTDYDKIAEEARLRDEEYRKILEAVKPDPVASSELFKKVITEDEVRNQIETELEVKKQVVMPFLPDSRVSVDSRSGKDVVLSYLNGLGAGLNNYNNSVLNTAKHLFDKDQDPGEIGRTFDRTNEYLTQLYAMVVPREMVSFHKATILNFEEFKKLLVLAKAYNLSEKTEPWSEIYKHYVVINNLTVESNKNFNDVVGRYNLAYLEIPKENVGFWRYVFGQKAEAQFGGPVVVVGDVPAAILQALKQAFATAFAKFATKFLDQTLVKIEENYRIANFLYYSDALVRGQYVNDYLNKYVPNTSDRGLITKFIPQFNCGQDNEDLRPIFKAKAREYLGFDPATVRPDDKDYLSKLFKLGTTFNDENIWELTFQDIARNAQSQAENAATKELLSTGYKTARTVDSAIATTLGTIENSQQALFNANLTLGTVNVENIVSQLVTSVLNNLFNKFLFNGAVVLDEQKVCISTPQFKPIMTTENVNYEYEAPKK